MADYTREQALAEAYKRGILPPDMAAAYEQASERGLLESSPEPRERRIQPSEYEEPITLDIAPSEAAMAGVDVTTGSPAGRFASGLAENEAVAADSYSKRLTEYYGEPVSVSKGEFGLEFIVPGTGQRTLIDEEQLTLRDVGDVSMGALRTGGAVAGGVGGLFFGLPNVGAGLGAGIGDAIGRYIGSAMGVRDIPVSEEAMGTAGVAALEFGASKGFEASVRGYQTVRQFFKPQVVSAEAAESLSIAARQNIEIAEEVSRRTGRELKPFTGQLTDDPKILGHHQSLKNDPETAIRFREQQAQNESVMEDFYDQLNPAPTAPNTAVGRSIQLEARDQTRPRVQGERDITEQAVDDLETITRELPMGDNSTIVNEATAAAAAARRVIKSEEDKIWNSYKSDMGYNPETGLSNIKIPVDGELSAIMRQFNAAAKQAIDPDDAAGLFRLQPNAFKPKTTTTMNPVTGRTNTVTTPAEVDLWQLQRYLGSLKRRQRLAGRNEVATDPNGRDVGDLIGVVQRQRDKYLKANYKEIGEMALEAEAKTTERATLFDEGLVSQLIRREQGEWLITDTQLIGGVIASGDKGAMQHLVAALGKHPAGVPTLQKSFLQVYRNEVIKDGVPDATLHRNFMERRKEAIDVLFPGDDSLKRLGNFEAAVTKRVKRFEMFEKRVLKTFRGKIQDISPEQVVTKIFSEKFSIKEVGHLMRLADAAGVGDLYSTAIRGQIRSRFYSKTTGINLNSLDKFLTTNEDKIITSLGGRYYRDMRILTSALSTIRKTESGISTVRRPGLIQTIGEGIARATVARPLSPHGVALTRMIRFNERAQNRAWAEIVENPDMLRAIIANKNTDVKSEAGARILGQLAGGWLIEKSPSMHDAKLTFEGENK